MSTVGFFWSFIARTMSELEKELQVVRAQLKTVESKLEARLKEDQEKNICPCCLDDKIGKLMVSIWLALLPCDSVV